MTKIERLRELASLPDFTIINPNELREILDLMESMRQNLDIFGEKYGFDSVAKQKFDAWNEGE